MKLRKHALRRSNAAMEALTPRVLLSARMVDTTLRIIGSDAEDVIVITSGAANTITVTDNGSTYDFVAASVGRIEVRVHGGDDKVWCDPSIDALRLRTHIDGGSGIDTITGAAGNDRIFGGEGNDKIYANGGNDTIYGDGGKDMVFAGGGKDQIYGGMHDDRLYGSGGDDTFWSGPGNDRCDGGIGNDLFYESTGLDTVYGGDGNDYAISAYLVYCGPGNDKVMGATKAYGEAGVDFLEYVQYAWGGEDRDYLIAAYRTDCELRGEGGDDQIRGAEGNDVLLGGDGNDYLSGGKGDDVIRGGNGNDVLRGGAGRDVLWGEDGDDNLYGFQGETSYLYPDPNDDAPDGEDIGLGQGGSDWWIDQPEWLKWDKGPEDKAYPNGLSQDDWPDYSGGGGVVTGSSTFSTSAWSAGAIERSSHLWESMPD